MGSDFEGRDRSGADSNQKAVGTIRSPGKTTLVQRAAADQAAPQDLLAIARPKIIAAVVANPGCVSQIDSWLATLLPDGLGVAGGIRNFGYAVANTYTGAMDPGDPETAAKVCTGIAHSTSLVITAAIARGQLPEVKSATTIDRNADSKVLPPHTATLVVLADDSEYVFDWHATLNSSNPKVLPKNSWLPEREQR